MTPWIVPAFAAGAVAGFVLTFLFFSQKISALQSEKKILHNFQSEFRLAASDAAREIAEQFLPTALKDLRQVNTEADHNLETRKNQIDSSIQDMKARIEESQVFLRQFEEERRSMYGRLEKSLSEVLNSGQLLRMETSALKKVLTAGTGVRGQWGEKILEEILEQNNLVRGIGYEKQVSLSGESANDSRPDFVINLPGQKRLIIDSKEVTGEYLLAQETEDPEKQKEHYAKLVVNIRTNFTRLSRKEYQALLDPDVPFVVMFIPSEAAIRAAFATDPGIFQEATSKKVILASPMTIAPLIYLIAHSWQKQKLADNARLLGETVDELGNRLRKFVEHLQGVRGGLLKATESWNSAVGNWQSRVSPQLEKSKELGGKLPESDDLASIQLELRQPAETEKNS